MSTQFKQSRNQNIFQRHSPSISTVDFEQVLIEWFMQRIKHLVKALKKAIY